MTINPTMFWTSIAVIIAAIYVFERLMTKKGKRTIMPPSPKGLPILGHLHLVGKNAHQDLHRLNRKHGEIIHLKFGTIDNIVVNTPKMAELFLRTHDLVCSSRPKVLSGKYLSYGQKDIAFGEYGLQWRNMRKLATLELLTNLKISSFQSMRREEIRNLIASIRKAAEARQAVDLSEMVAAMSVNTSTRMVFGEKYEDKDIKVDRGFRAAMDEIQYLTAYPNLGDLFPVLARFDLQGLTKRMKTLASHVDDFLERIIEEHENKKRDENETAKDFVDTMLDILKNGDNGQFQPTREDIKSTMIDMLVASMDTSSSVIEWTMSELLRYPEEMKKVKAELKEKIGYDRFIEEEDLDNLPYFKMMIKEGLRMHPAIPLLIPHYAREDITVDGYHVPKNSRIIVNVWGIGHNPDVWENPEKFNPERFRDISVDYKGRDYELLPFGSGRRSCPGMQLGATVVQLVLANLIHSFDWELPNGMSIDKLDMSEELGLVVRRAKNLVVVPTKYKMNI